MTNRHFSFIIITFNEELNLPRLLDSIALLNAQTYVLDSGSTDGTLPICKKALIPTKFHKFVNHPRQWETALSLFEINTPWVICLDADQTLSPELFRMLRAFEDKNYNGVDGIYFNRKYYFKGKWIRFGGHYPKFLLKMFRYSKGFSDLNENMDHRFQVPGKTVIWKTAYLLEENLKENQISFWINKHNRYSDLLSDESFIRKNNSAPGIEPRFFGSPNEHNAWLKKIWSGIPLHIRPFLYFGYRTILQLGILDGKTGITFHFLQGFWFRLIVDIKIEEKKQALPGISKDQKAVKFLLGFFSLFLFFYLTNILCIAITTPGGYFSNFMATHFNYISAWRKFCIVSSSHVLEYLGYTVHINPTGLSVKNHSGFRLIYSCLGYGVMSCFAAFVLSFPKPLYTRLWFFITGLAGIQVLNTLRFVFIAICYKPEMIWIDHHDIFNCLLYFILVFTVYFWIKPHANPLKKEF